MPAYSYECPKHGIFELTMPLRKWSDRKPCPQCKKISEQVLLPQRGDGHFSIPIVVQVDSQGNVRFPGSADAKCPKGFERKELRSIREVEQFERHMNTKLQSEARDHQEREEQHWSAIQERNRSDLRQRMMSMSPMGRAFAEHAIRVNNSRKRKPTEVGFHCHILHYDASQNPQIDESTGWKRKYF